jgi:hypothetical protein
MSGSDTGAEVPCIKCGLVDVKANLIPLGFWLGEGAPLPRVAGYISAWVHLTCWKEYNETRVELQTVDAAAEVAGQISGLAEFPHGFLGSEDEAAIF